MGMFDYIIVECDLPEKPPELTDNTFQTKDFENLMDSYIITKDKELILNKVKWEEVPEKDRPYYGSKDWENPLLKWVGSFKTIPLGIEKVDFTGKIRFYTSTDPVELKVISFDKTKTAVETKEYIWVEYEAIIEHGNVKEITVVEISPYKVKINDDGSQQCDLPV